MPDDSPLQSLRATLDSLDADLLDLAARRLDTVRAIAAAKSESQGPLFDRRRERDVLERARLRGESLGLPAGVAEHLVHTLIEAGHRLQEQRLAEATSTPPRRVLIVGGLGTMGRLFARAFRERGHHVDVLDRDDPRDTATVVAWADVVVLSVTMPVAEQVARQIVPLVRADALVCDLNSLKTGMCALYEELAPGQAVGLHPMFGGTVGSLRRQKVVVCPVRSGDQVQWLLTELGQLGLELIETTPEAHDRIMGVVQVLLHFRTIAMGEALRRVGVPVWETLRFTSPIYRLELSVVARLFAQDPDLYASILLDNPVSSEMRQHLAAAAAEVDALLSAGDREGFRDLFLRVRAYFEGFSEEAMRRSDALIDTLTEQP